ncbi:brefeldin A-inhibited guanine nucleotide-exchange protein 1-like [Andrographis paniculata]|uniref:brefeldin A-inhibited guanine nucleotide-exchange protein 1-like n=1 Tax=Andrographis paniculata TaxID=175694 RepID=UPI0021E883C0|nr:brefeldin A-inhibited guanine nucleotide-exchange protein 1-like [Andrographis paniculata]
MTTLQTLGGSSRCGWVLGPSLDKIIKNASWRKHSSLVAACKSALDKLESLADDATSPASCTPLYGLSSSDAELLIQPLIMALGTASPKVVEPALDCAFRLFSFGIIRGCEIKESSSLVFRLVDSVCKCSSLGDEAIELDVLKVLLSAVRSPCVYVRGDCLVYIVKTCYNVYLSGRSGTNQICAKAVLAQMMIIVFTRVEENSILANFKNVIVFELLEFSDRNLNEGSSIHFSQNFINEIVEAKQSPADMKLLSVDLQNVLNNSKEETGEGKSEPSPSGYSDFREDGFILYRNLCKLSMKFSSNEQSDDQILLRGKILSLELLNVIMANAGPIWCSNERFLSTIKQYLCVSLLKNSTLSVMTIFQLLTAIFHNLLSKFRYGLKSEIGIFFPMLILRVLENVLQPSFLQKMTVLSLVEKFSQDSQGIIDIFVNYDCDVDSPNIFERTVNGLLKTAQGPPPGSTTSLSPAQDTALRLESVKCLVRIIKSMGLWMDKQLKVVDSNPQKSSDNENMKDNINIMDETKLSDYDLHTEANSELSDAATLEKRRAYKLEIQRGIALFNKNPSKGIDFLISNKKVGSSPEKVASFLKSTPGLSESMIGDYFGEREEFPMKVMHAYVDSFNFDRMGFGEAIRFFLRGFRLPGEAQKIDRIMEKFAERYCKCNPNAFTSADTAYVLAYSVIMLNTDAHNSMVKDKMSKADFIRNNRGIDGGKNLPELYLSTLYDDIVKNEIQMSTESCAPQSRQGNSLNKLLGLDGILNLVWKQSDEKAMGANGYLIKHIQEQFKAKSKSEDIYHAVTDPTILKFMVEVCWGPMLAAFSVTLDKSDDKEASAQCMEGFRHAIHITSVMGMQTQRDAFVTTVAKFTYLHCAADMKQKNVDAVKAIISIAIEDGNYLQEAWEHILTCLSRFEHLQLLGEGAPPDAPLLNSPRSESEDKSSKSSSLKRKEALQNPAVMAVVRGGSYDSTSTRAKSSGLVSPEQINNFISNLHLLDQIGNFELNHIFGHSQRLNSDAIVSFVTALCKVAMSELQSTTEPRVFSLTKLVEVAHYNMNRIRLVWSRMWSVLSEFFVSVGLSENLSAAIFVMDSLRQLAMKFLEREELGNYNFQNEFMKPFVVVMQSSSSPEIRELIVRCISQMVLSRFSNIKSGWKSVFMVLTAAAADERKTIVLLAFETMEKIVREYFTYITETEALTFTDCVMCLVTFTNNKFNDDVSLNAIAFLRFCAVKLADDGIAWNEKSKCDALCHPVTNSDDDLGSETSANKSNYMHFWDPLLSGLSTLTLDPRPPVRKSALEVLFNILKDHGHLFPQPFWNSIFDSAIFPVFNSTKEAAQKDDDGNDDRLSPKARGSTPLDGNDSEYETNALAGECLVDLFVHFFDQVRPQHRRVLSILAIFVRDPNQAGPSNAGVAALMRLATDLKDKLSDEEWSDIFLCLHDAAGSDLPHITKLLEKMNCIEVPDASSHNNGTDLSSDHADASENDTDKEMQTAAYIISQIKNHIAVQLLIIQVVTDLYKMHWQYLSLNPVSIVLDAFSSIARRSHELNSNQILLSKVEKACSYLEISCPQTVHFENDSYHNYLNFLHDQLAHNAALSKELDMESKLLQTCNEMLQMYLDCAGFGHKDNGSKNSQSYCVSFASGQKEELAARSPLVLSVMRVLVGLERDSFRRYISPLFPSLVDLIRVKHSSREVQHFLSNIFQSCIGPIIM